MANYGEALRTIRRQSDMTQQELANRLNVTAQTVSKWENGVNQMDLATVQQVCELFNITVDAFLRLAEGAEGQTAAVAPEGVGHGAAAATVKKAGDFPFVIVSAVLAVILAVLIALTAVFVAPKKLSATKIYEKVNPSVFFIEVDVGNGTKKGGSGFFIDSKGTAVTNYHVIEDGMSASVTLHNGEKYNVKEVVGVDIERDVAIVKVDIARSRGVSFAGGRLKTGETVYAIGYPESFTLGVTDSTLTDGIVSKASYQIDGVEFIQTNADITHGNSGGVLVNAYGKVVGVTTGQIDLSGVTYMNLAVPVSAVKSVKRDISLTLKQFKEEYHTIVITFADGDDVYLKKTVRPEQRVEFPDGNNREGYEFDGWFKDAEFKTRFDSYVFREDTTVYGKWTPHAYTIRFEAEGAGGTMSDLTVRYGEEIALPQNAFIKRGNGLEYWDGGKFGTFRDGQTVKNITSKDGDEVLLKAVWKPLETGLVFDGNGAETGGTQPVVLIYGQSVRLPACGFQKRGYEFDGWEWDGRTYRAGEEVRELTDTQTTLTLKALWKPVTYNVRYYDEDSGQSVTRTFTYAEEHVLKTELTAEKYAEKITGWRFNGKIYPVGKNAGDFTDTKDATVELIAVWGPIEYTVEFDTKGGGALPDATISFGEHYVYPDPMPTGYHLRGWEVTQNGEYVTTSLDLGRLTDVDGAHFKATAVYDPISYRVELYWEDNGYTYDIRNLYYDEEFVMPTPDPAQVSFGDRYTGREFVGWYCSRLGASFEAGQTVKNLTTKQYLYSGDEIVIYGQWRNVRYTVNFDGNGGTGTMQPQTFAYGSATALTANAFTRSGYFFTGWKCSEDFFNDGAELYNYTSVPATFTFVAQWEAVFENGAGTAQSPYVIDSYAELNKMSKAVYGLTGGNTAYYTLAGDIDCEGKELLPIGNADVPFAGVFEGADHVIKNASFVPSGNYCGLFGYVRHGTLKNFGVVSYRINDCGSAARIAPVAGFIVSTVPVENVFAEGEVSFDYTDKSFYVSGFIADLRAPVRNCYSAGSISVTLNHAEDCSLDSKIGGFVAHSDHTWGDDMPGGGNFRIDPVPVQNCYADVDITVERTGRGTGVYGVRFYVGGFAGEAEYAEFENVFTTGNIVLKCNVAGNNGFDFVGKFMGNKYGSTGDFYGCSDAAFQLNDGDCTEKTWLVCTAEYTRTEYCTFSRLQELFGFDADIWTAEEGQLPKLKAFTGGMA